MLSGESTIVLDSQSVKKNNSNNKIKKRRGEMESGMHNLHRINWQLSMRVRGYKGVRVKSGRATVQAFYPRGNPAFSAFYPVVGETRLNQIDRNRFGGWIFFSRVFVAHGFYETRLNRPAYKHLILYAN